MNRRLHLSRKPISEDALFEDPVYRERPTRWRSALKESCRLSLVEGLTKTHSVSSSHKGSVVDVLCSLIVSVFSQTGWLAPSPRSVGGPMVMNVFSSLWSPLHCYSMPGRMKNRLRRQETNTERMFGCWLLSYQPFSHLMKQLSALRLIKYPPDAGQSCRVARPQEGYIRF